MLIIINILNKSFLGMTETNRKITKSSSNFQAAKSIAQAHKISPSVFRIKSSTIRKMIKLSKPKKLSKKLIVSINLTEDDNYLESTTKSSESHQIM